MGTWAAGPFENDAALDFTDDIATQLVEAVESFVRSPRIDGGFDEAFAAVGLLNVIAKGSDSFGMAGSPITVPEPGDARRWRAAMLECFDEQIEELSPKAGFVEAQRAKLVEHLDRLVATAEATHA